MNELKTAITEGGSSFDVLRVLVTLKNEDISQRSKAEITEGFEILANELLDYKDKTCDAASAARFFNRKRSWIYEATSRPSTEFQRRLAEVAHRKSGVLVFRVSDLVELRRTIWQQE